MALNDVGTRQSESSRFDPGMLRRIGSYRRLFEKGRLNSIVLPATSLYKSARLDAAVAQSARDLADATPQPRRVRVVGRLDLMGVSQGILKLHIASGGIVTALWDGEGPLEQFTALFNQEVICEGVGVFRPSGSMLRIDADALALATERDDFFRHAPLVPANSEIVKSIRLRAGEPSVYAGFLGVIPPAESDEEFAAAVGALS